MISKIKLKITGRNPDYFLNLLINKGINIELIEKNRKYIVILVSSKDYDIIKSIKTSYKIRVLNVYGFLYMKYLLKTYSFFIFMFFICAGIIIFISNIILDVSVISSKSEIRKEILEDLKVRGISKYRLKVSYDERERIIGEILDEEKDSIEWLEIEEYGTKYIINVVERVKNNDSIECVPSNIVASRDAIVTDISATSGEVMTSINKSVKKGDILISGVIYNKDDIKNIKCARGKVFGEVWYQVYVDLPLHYVEENVTGKVDKKLGIDFFGYSSKSSFKTYKRKDINILNNKLLPIRLFYTEFLETSVTDIKFDINNVDKYAIDKAIIKLKDSLGDEDEILLKKNLKKEQKNSRIIVGVFFKVREDITEVQEINETLPIGE